MYFYFTDRKFNLLGIASDDRRTKIRMTGVKDSLSIKRATRLFDGNIEFNRSSANTVKDMAMAGNYILYRDSRGKNVWLTIMEFEHNPAKGAHYFSAEDAGMDLINETVPAYKADKAYPIAYYINKFTADSGFEIGINEISDLTRTLTWESESSTSLARIISVATQFDNAELDFSFEIEGLEVTRKLINIYKKRGSDKRVTLNVDYDINNIITKGNIYNLFTSAYATGGTPQGKDEPINLKGYKYTDPSGRFVLGTDGVMRDTVAVRKWSRLLSKDNPNPKSSHIQRVLSFETTSQKVLCDTVVRQLEQNSEIYFDYEVDLAKLPDNTEIGDTIYLADEFGELYLSARVLEINQEYSSRKYTAVLGDYVIQDSGISSELQDLANKLQNSVPYIWTRYADDDQGTGMTAEPAGKSYMANKTVKGIETPSDDPADYAGLWVKIKGDDGVGEKGEDGFSPIITPNEDGTITIVDEEGTKTTPDLTGPPGADGKDGVTGAQGPKGDQGIQGPKGADGKTQYTHIAYANSADGTVDFSVSNADRKYIGMYVDFTATDSTTPSDYAWTLVKGADGAQGTAGKAGADGKTPYFHTAWANSADGKTGFSTTVSAGKTYLGTYTDYTQADSTDPTKYAWSLIKGDKGDTGPKGDDGVAGKDGVGLKSTAIQYAQSTSGTTAPTTGWTNSVPTLVKGQYLWTKTVWTYTDNSSETGYTVSYNAKDGNTGKDGIAGKDGVGISNTVIEYVGAVSGTSKPTSGWSNTIPTVPQGQYLWTRTTWTYTDGTKEQGYSTALMGPKGDKGDTGAKGTDGKDGAQGVPGEKGADGKTSYLHTGWKMADGTFTTDYPGENIWLSSNPQFLKPNWVYSADNKSFIYNVPNTAVAIFYLNKVLKAAFPDDEGVGRTLTVSFDVESQVEGLQFSNGNMYINDSLIVAHNRPTLVVGEKKRVYASFVYKKASSDTSVVHIYITAPSTLVGNIIISGVKVEVGENTNPIHTPAPSEDYTLAYPKWRGEYTDFTAADSTNPDDYTWTAYLGQSGQDGNNGADGVGIASTAVTYQASSNGTTAPTGTWSTTIPSVAANQYLWTRTVISYTNNTSSTAYSVGKMGANGATGPAGTPGKDGSNGANGVSVTSVVEEYYISTSPTSQAGGSWSTTVPNNADPNKYIWRRMKNTFSDGTVTYTNPALIQGMTGIYPYIGPTQPANPKEGQQWWKSDSSGNVTNFYVYKNGSWQGQTIQQSILNIVALNAVTITGSTITGTNINGSVFTNTFTIDLGVSDTGTGTTVIRDGAIKMDMAVKDSAGTASYTQGQELSMQNGLYMWQKLEGQSAANQSYARLTPAGLDLQSIAGGAVRNTTLSIDSIYSLVRPASRNIKPADDANRANVSLNYYRVGNLVSLGIKFDLLKDTGWVALAPVPPTGYTPYSGTQATTVAGSLSYRGQSCLVYYNAQGFRLIPTTGQGTGTFQAGITYVTEDPFPYGDS